MQIAILVEYSFSYIEYLIYLSFLLGSQTVFLRNGPLPPKHVYALEQFHAHWGSNEYRGSEHIVDGKSHAAELHLVFWNTQYKSFKEAMTQSDGLAVLAVFLEEGETRKNELHQVYEDYQKIFS